MFIIGRNKMVNYYQTSKPLKCSLVPRPPRPTGERRSGTVASNSWSKRQTSFPLKKYVLYNELPF